MKRRFVLSVNSVVAVVAVAVAVAGCATTNGSNGRQTTSTDDGPSCLAAAAIAAMGCGLIGRGNKIAQAAACGVGAFAICEIAKSYTAEKVKTAKQVEDDYLRKQSQLPERAVLAGYDTQVNPNHAVSKGQTVTLASNIVVVPGKQSENVVIEEEVSLLDAGGEQWGSTVKKQANSGGEAGEYRTSFNIPVHKDMSQGIYMVKKVLYLNGSPVETDAQSKFQVVYLDGRVHIAMVQ